VSSIVVVGDTLLDRDVLGTVERLSPDAPIPVVDQETVRSRPGGAGLAAVLAAADATAVTLVTALADDAAGEELRALLAARGIGVVALDLDGATPEKLRIGPPGRPLLRLDRGAGVAPADAIGEPDAAVRAAIGWADVLLVADYGRGVAAAPAIRALLADAAAPLVWDPHPRGADPLPGAALVTPNLAEAHRLESALDGDATPAVAQRARALAARWRAGAVCVTCGARGAVLVDGEGPPVAVPAEPAAGGDPCGAGDRFAARAAAALARGAGTVDAVVEAVGAASRFVADGGAASIGTPVDARADAPAAGPRPHGSDEAGPGAPCADGAVTAPDPDGARHALAVAERVRDRGGTVVATGGCFDLLHPGHIRTLQAARGLGDCLIVCVNSDASVRRLKGPGRPVVAEQDRAAVLHALSCVDAVVVFGEDTPVAALERLRPDLWAKGGDYADRELPEAAVLARWGGEAVLLPYVSGKSTTRIIEEASLRAIG
jgi:rfaE bifunctional protein nucleotidyltransferase chain/domain/rfaE bifunctional protein kinase chain/domain